MWQDVELLDSNFDEYALKFAFMFINKNTLILYATKKIVTPNMFKEVYYSVFSDEKELNPEKCLLTLL